MPDITLTPNLKLSKLPANYHVWAALMNNNLTMLDAAVSGFIVFSNLRGAWTNSTVYNVGDTVVDSTSAIVYQCDVANTSSSIPTTFVEERANHPTYWSTYSTAARNKGAWAGPGIAYSLNDFVVSGSQYAVCTAAHVSSALFSTDVALGRWSILVDLSTVGSQVLPVPGGPADADKFTVTNSAGTGYTIINSNAALTILGATSVGMDVFTAPSQAAAVAAIGAAPLDSPVFTGSPTAPTPPTADNDNSIATTAFVKAQAYAPIANPTFTGTLTANIGFFTGNVEGQGYIVAGASSALGFAGRSIFLSPSDGVINATTNNGASPATMTAATQVAGTNNTSVATTAFVQTALGSAFETGDFVITMRTTKGTGWLKCDDGTIGSAASAGTSRANADTVNLFTLLWTNCSNAICPVSGGRGASAAADFAANKTIALTKMLGRALVIAGTGSGLTARTLGDIVGSETHNHGGSTGSSPGAITSQAGPQSGTDFQHTHTISSDTLMQPSSFVNVFIHL